MFGLINLLNSPDPVRLRKAQTYAQFASGVSPYASADVAATDAMAKAATAQAQRNTLQQLMSAPAGMADRMAYDSEVTGRDALAKRMMQEKAAKEGLYNSYLGQLSREDAIKNQIAQAQTEAANQYGQMSGQLVGQLAGIGLGAGQWMRQRKIKQNLMQQKV
jgi:hypothetical protein